MKYVHLSWLLALLIIGCNGKESKMAPLKIGVEMKTFQLKSEPIDGDSVAIARYKVAYPVFVGIDTMVAHQITFKIDSILTQGYSEALPLTLQQASQEFLRQFDEYRQGDSGPAQGWYFTGAVGVNIASDTLISMAVFRDEYTGGEHPNTRTDYLNIDPHTGKAVYLSHELEEGFESTLTARGEKIFRDVRNISEAGSLAGNYFEFPDDKFKLTNNYGFTAKGIVFLYNNYEIAPYSAGPTEVMIPYAQVKDLLK